MLLCRTLLIGVLIAGIHSAAKAAEQITVVSWGGAYEAAQQRSIFAPFTAQTGIKVNVRSYTGGVDSLRQRAGSEGWDVIDMTEDDAISACSQGLLGALEHREILVPSRKSSLRDDFVPGAFRTCSVAQNIYATVFAYSEKDFPGIKPGRIEDFFDLDAFPGKRAVQRSPDVILEWALMAEGVPVSQIYDLLSTDRGLAVAFRKLDQIRSAIIWWSDPAEPPQMLSDGRAVMASGFNGRFFAATNAGGAAISIVWDSQQIGYEVWAVSASSQNRTNAELFIGFATQPDQLARLAEHIPYTPARHSALPRIGRHWRSHVPMRYHLPNKPRPNERLLYRDSAWYANTRALREQRFDEWLSHQQE